MSSLSTSFTPVNQSFEPEVMNCVRSITESQHISSGAVFEKLCISASFVLEEIYG